MQEKMSLDARRELLERVSERYRFARVGEKTPIPMAVPPFYIT